MNTSLIRAALAACLLAAGVREGLAQAPSPPSGGGSVVAVIDLERVFAGMADHLDTEHARDAEAVLEWHITGREDGGHDRFQVVVRHGTCLTARDGDASPDVIYTIGGVDFLRLVTGSLTGPELFMTGRLVVEGDLLLGAMTQTWFRMPGSPASTGA